MQGEIALPRQAGGLHVKFGSGDAVEQRPQPRFGPQPELASETVFLLEENWRAGCAHRLFESRPGCQLRGEYVQPMKVA